MATITGLTAERMLEIEGASVVSGEIVGGNLILTKFDGTTIDAGPIPPGPQGPTGPAGGQIPGEVKLWPGSSLPPAVDFGNWVWADGAVYAVATYPEAAANIATQWRTFAGASDPGAPNFRVPDLRGLVPAGMDQMPGGARANRLTRSVSIVLAGRSGEEIHTITIPEMPAHSHAVTDPGHVHPNSALSGATVNLGASGGANVPTGAQKADTAAVTGVTIANAGGGVAHENMQPTVFVPYIVKLDD
jgi:microcystin-dependent protein